MQLKTFNFLISGVLLLFGIQSTASAVVSPDDYIGIDKVWPRPLQIEIYSQENYFLGICSGVLIEKDVLLTAAHCLIKDAYFKIKYTKADSGTDYIKYGPSVKGYLGHPRYNKYTKVNDIGFIILDKPITDLPLSRIPFYDKNLINSDDLIIMGWGENQNGDSPEKYAAYARGLSNYSSNASKRNIISSMESFLNTDFNENTMIAAGKYRPEERLYTGGCFGDSGGPLLAFSNGSFYVVGITSGGSENCNLMFPTLFTKVSYYTDWICYYIITESNYSDKTDCKNLSKQSMENSDKIGNSNNTEESIEIVEENQSVSTEESVEIVEDNQSVSTDESLEIVEDNQSVSTDESNGIIKWVIIFIFILLKGLVNLFTSDEENNDKEKTQNINNRQTLEYELVKDINTVPNKSKEGLYRGTKQNSNYYGLNRGFYNFREAGAIYCCLDVDKSNYLTQVFPIFETDESAVIKLPEEYSNEDNITIKVNNIYFLKIDKSYDIYITLYFI